MCMIDQILTQLRRSPHGERGLKYGGEQRQRPRAWSLSSWRAWIEMDTDIHMPNRA